MAQNTISLADLMCNLIIHEANLTYLFDMNYDNPNQLADSFKVFLLEIIHNSTEWYKWSLTNPNPPPVCREYVNIFYIDTNLSNYQENLKYVLYSQVYTHEYLSNIEIYKNYIINEFFKLSSKISSNGHSGGMLQKKVIKNKRKFSIKAKK